MGRNNYCIKSCVGVVIFLDTGGGLYKIVETVVKAEEIEPRLLAVQIVAGLLLILSGVLLLMGAVKREPKYVLSHIVLVGICLFLAIIGFLVILLIFLGNTTNVGAIIIFISAAVLFWRICLEYSVYLFYKNMNSESLTV
ncbi:uncharacterized protein LOC135134428 [Zophobas morio]|uniref:uncharacterized protein LOC135134428 n=1 Tax=Zophobas morio TaxID=2755281 RepID=UPI0030828C5C